MRAKCFCVAVALSVAAALGGCASSVDTVQTASLPNPVRYAGPVPSFSGPWAAGFADAYRLTTSRLDHEILAHGKITNAGYLAVGDVFISCMSRHGYKVELGSMIDTFSIDSPGLTKTQMAAQTKALNACQIPFEAVSSLFLQVRQNPRNQDLDTLVVRCFLKDRISPTSYTVAEYKANLESQKFPFNIDSPGATACLASPLGLDLSTPTH